MSAMKPSTKYYLMALVALFVMAAVVTTADAARKKYKAKASDDAYLGIYMQEVDKDLAEALNLDVDYGAFVTDVVNDSPADDAGLRDRDVIIEFDGKKVNDTDELTDMIESHQPGDSVTVKVLRHNKERDLAVELGEDNQTNFSIYSGNGNVWSNFNNGTFWSNSRGGYLGISTTSLTDQLADYFGVKYGVLIDEVEEDSPAAKAGLKAGDVITRIDDEQVDSPSDLAEIIGDHEDGDEINVTVSRDHSEQTLAATLEEGNGLSGIQGIDPLILNIPTPPTPARYYFDARDNYREQMEELKDQMKNLKEELEAIREKLK